MSLTYLNDDKNRLFDDTLYRAIITCIFCSTLFILLYTTNTENPDFEIYAYAQITPSVSPSSGLISNSSSGNGNSVESMMPINQNTNYNDDSLTKLYDKVDQSVVQVTYDSDVLGKSRLGSGFVYDKLGHIITNYHVISGVEPDKQFDITFIDGSTYKASVVGSDPYSEIAVLKIDKDNNYTKQLENKLIPLQIGNFSEVKVGQRVAAIGNPFGLSASITEGIVSGLGRLLPTSSSPPPSLPPYLPDFDQFPSIENTPSYSIPNIIQTDAAINPGNSGGPLLNINGEVIGINTAIFSNTGAYTGVGFAVPSYLIQQIVPSLIKTGKYEHSYLGISGTDVNSDIAKEMHLQNSTGFLVIDVSSGSPAEKAGIRGGSVVSEINGRQTELGGDVIIGVDNNTIRKIDDLLSYLEREKQVGNNITLSIIRDGQLEKVNLTLASRPATLEPSNEMTTNAQENRPTLGITGITVTPQIALQIGIPPNITDGEKGFLVIDVLKNGSAYNAGIKGGYISDSVDGNQIELGGDIILAIDNSIITSTKDIRNALSTKQVGDKIELTIYRDNQTLTIPVILNNESYQTSTQDNKMPRSPLENPNPFPFPFPFPLEPFNPSDNFGDSVPEQCNQIINKETCDRIFGK
jgi:S1-C subfamily serine protease